MRWIVVLLASLAGLTACDRVFGLGDPYEDARTGPLDAPGPSDDVLRDGTGSGATLIASFPFDGDYDDAVSQTSAMCSSTIGSGCVFGQSHNTVGMSASFDGSTCVMFRLPATPAAISIALWVEASSGSTETLLTRPAVTSTATASWFLQEDNDSIYFVSGSTTLTGTPGPAAGTWHAVAVTMGPDGSVAYLDGAVAGVGAPAAILYTADLLYIGCDASTATLDNFHGQIDNVEIFDGILDQNAVMQLAR